jgi:hypothetical protein
VLCYTEEEPSYHHVAHGMYLPRELSHVSLRVVYAATVWYHWPCISGTLSEDIRSSMRAWFPSSEIGCEGRHGLMEACEGQAAT